MRKLRCVIRRTIFIFPVILAAAALAAPARAQSPVGGVQPSTGAPLVAGRLPSILQGVNFQQRLGAQVPLDATFTDESGNPVVLRSYFEKRPVVLILAYYRCPMLCSEVLHGATSAFKKLSFRIGQQFNVLTVSIDPRETPALARSTQSTYIEQYGDPSAAAHWHFLTGKKSQIDALADAVGFHYKYIPQIDQYAHAAGITVLTPAGKVAQYFYGIQFAPENLRLALVQSSHEKIGSFVDQVLLYCCTYDPATGSYHAIISRTLQVAGGLTILVVGGGIFLLLWWDAKHRNRR